MIGRQVLITNKAFEMSELLEYLKGRWNAEEYSEISFGKPTSASLSEYILLPASRRYMVIIYPKKAGGLFNKKNKVILAVCDSPSGAVEKLAASVTAKNIVYNAVKMKSVMSAEAERKGPAEDSLLKYTEYVKGILEKDGYLA